MGKFEFWKVPFGLAQAPAYFQWLDLQDPEVNLNFKLKLYFFHIAPSSP